MTFDSRLVQNLNKIPKKFEWAREVFIEEGLTPQMTDCFENLVQPAGTGAINDWYPQNETDSNSQAAIGFIDLVEFLGGAGVAPFNSFPSTCHRLEKNPLLWIGSNSQWGEIALFAKQKIRSLVARDCTLEIVFNTLSDVAHDIQAGMWQYEFAPPGDAIRSARAWAIGSRDTYSATCLTGLCDLMDELEIF